MYFEQHQILTQTDPTVHATRSVLLIEGMQDLYVTLNKSDRTWLHP